MLVFFFFSSRRRHTRYWRDWSSDVCSSDLAAKLQQPAEYFTTNRDFLRGVARLGGFLARKSDGDPGWQTIWKGWVVLKIGRASCRGKSVDLGGRRIIKKKKY